MNEFLIKLIERYPELRENEVSLQTAFDMIIGSLNNRGTFFVCGNGGSAADSEHIVGELLKGFIKKRPLPDEVKEKFNREFGAAGMDMANKLQGGLKAIALTSHPAFGTAFLNDVDSSLIFAQQLYGLGSEGDILLGITCSGNAQNIYKAMMAAKIKGIKTVLLTGNKNGRCTEVADCIIAAPSSETYLIQEYHLPIYHTLCMMIEDHFYER